MALFEQINNSTFKEVAEIKKDHIRQTIIGNSESGSFEPMIEIQPWNEDKLRFWKDTHWSEGISSRLTSKNRLVWQDSKEEITFTPLMEKLHSRFADLNAQNDISGAKFVIKLTSKPTIDPDGNARFTWKMSGHKDMGFYPQSTLAEEALTYPKRERADFLSKAQPYPAHIIDSIAVYHKTKANNQYTTGKVCHIYRSWCEDSLGNFTWGKWEFDLVAGTITKVIPESAFNHIGATWWLVDATFGNTSVGGLTIGFTNGVSGPYASASGYSPADGDGDVDDIQAHAGTSSGTHNLKGGIWHDADQSLLTNGESDSVSFDGAQAWRTVTYTTTPEGVLDANTYEFGVTADNAAGLLSRDFIGSTSGFVDFTGGYTIPDPLVIGNNNSVFSVFINYTPGAETVTPDKWHPETERPYLQKTEVTNY